VTIGTLVDALVQICEVDDNTNYVDALLLQARAAVTAAAGSIGDFETGSVNGKTFTRKIQLTPAETIVACIRAKRLFMDQESPQVVHTDFSRTLGGSC
jgi:hypothetical protein